MQFSILMESLSTQATEGHLDTPKFWRGTESSTAGGTEGEQAIFHTFWWSRDFYGLVTAA